MRIPRQKTLFIDAGNTRIKAASKQTDQWRIMGVWAYDDPAMKSDILELSHLFKRIVLSSVKKTMQVPELQRILIENGITGVDIFGISRDSLPGERIDYRTFETLGVDRFLASLGAWGLESNRSIQSQIERQNQFTSQPAGPSPVIVTDAGTACTIDIMDAEGVFRGGVIMPGLHLLAASLGESADGLFRVDARLPATWPPDSTETALQAGTAGTFLAAWESHVERSLGLYPDAQIWLTGGDAEFLLRHTKRSCQKHDHLVFEGMNEWIKIAL